MTLRDLLLLVLSERGGDFQSASFTADTVVRFERVYTRHGSRYVHVREREIGELVGMNDLVDFDAYAGDFMGED